MLAGLLGRRYGWLPEAGELATGTGERRDFTLEDGSALSLNARTRVVAQFDAVQRLLALRTGELLVDVAKDCARPFVVETEHGRMRALGTKFLVQQGDDFTRLVMLHSQVEVVTAGGARQVVEAGRVCCSTLRTFWLWSAAADRKARGCKVAWKCATSH